MPCSVSGGADRDDPSGEVAVMKRITTAQNTSPATSNMTSRMLSPCHSSEANAATDNDCSFSRLTNLGSNIGAVCLSRFWTVAAHRRPSYSTFCELPATIASPDRTGSLRDAVCRLQVVEGMAAERVHSDRPKKLHLHSGDSDRTLIDRYRGCLLGLACGDALGGPIEFETRAAIRERFPGGLRDFIGGGWLHLIPGEITDDTQMTLALAESLACSGPLDMDDVAARFLSWFRSEPEDIGNTTRSALSYLANGVPWEEAGERVISESPSAAGNAAVMRCAPVALRFRTAPAQLVPASV